MTYIMNVQRWIFWSFSPSMEINIVMTLEQPYPTLLNTLNTGERYLVDTERKLTGNVSSVANLLKINDLN